MRSLLALGKRIVHRPYRAVTDSLARRFFEHGVHDTSGLAELQEFGVERRGLRRYDPSGWFYLHRALRGMRITRDDVFLEYGSGKGRVVYQAARRPFGRVIGVEIAEQMTRIASENIAHNRHRLRCHDVELVTCDATEYEVPDDVNYAYIFNAFTADVFRAVLARLVASLDRKPRRLTLLYVNPMEDELVRETGRFMLASTRKGLRRDLTRGRIQVWVSSPPTGDGRRVHVSGAAGA